MENWRKSPKSWLRTLLMMRITVHAKVEVIGAMQVHVYLLSHREKV